MAVFSLLESTKLISRKRACQICFSVVYLRSLTTYVIVGLYGGHFLNQNFVADALIPKILNFEDFFVNKILDF